MGAISLARAAPSGLVCTDTRSPEQEERAAEYPMRAPGLPTLVIDSMLALYASACAVEPTICQGIVALRPTAVV